MNQSNSEKKLMEIAAVELFIKLCRELYNIEYTLIAVQERPDVLLDDISGNKLGMEVTHLFYSDIKAKIILGKMDEHKHSERERFEKYLSVLNELLAKKAQTGSQYRIDFPCSLLIKETSPYWTRKDFEEGRALIKLPQGIYQDIWLICDDKKTEWSLMKLNS